MPNTTCPKCGGTGTIIDHKPLLAQRQASGRTGTEVARAMKISVSYLCDLEHGRRDWTPQLVMKFVKALK